MHRLRDSLRFRLAFTFALFGILISLLLSTGLFIAAHNLAVGLMNETLSAEIDDFLARRARNPHALLPATITMHGYVHRPGEFVAGMPDQFTILKPGDYHVELEQTPYQVIVVDKGPERFVMMFNATTQQHREQTFLAYLAICALTMTAISAWMGWWLAGLIVSPITELARRVNSAKPGDDENRITQGFSNDEVGKLATVFGGYLGRIRSFMDRESAFTADVSHELRTPLAIVQGVVELMAEDERLDDKQKERIRRIGRANREMIDMTSALLLMAREETAEEPVVQQCDIWDVVSGAVETYRHLLNPGTDVELVCTQRTQVAAERTLLTIVISNLIRNAFAYTLSGKVTIRLDGQGLTVSDTGSGISGEEIGKVFERLYKGADSAGTGIGLSLVKRICDRYGWKTEILSSLGKGTTVKLSFSG